MNEFDEHEPVFFEHISCVPFDQEVFSYVGWGQYIPHTYTNWREETLSWKNTCYLSANLSCFPTLTISGPDAVKLVSDISVNNYENFSVGSCKHMIICSAKGNVLDHGLILKTGDQELTSYITPFYLLYRAEQGNYDVQIESSTPENRAWVFQLAGPKSLEILEHTLKEDVHDLKFMKFKQGMIAGHEVRILRMGMGGSLSYEVHGFTDSAGIDVYNKLMKVGKPYGIAKLGVNQYVCNHTENGFPQTGLHFPGALLDDPGYIEYMQGVNFYEDASAAEARGNWSDNIEDYYRNPFELGWGHMVNLEHDFIGKEALLMLKEKGHRKLVTLEWDSDDILKVFASFFETGAEPYDDMPFPVDFGIMGSAENRYQQNRVSKSGKTVGVSMWRTYTLYYRKTISLCCIDNNLAEEGTEVSILWGDHGNRQVEIKAKVARYPYLDLVPNQKFNLEDIPRFIETKYH